MEGGEDEDDSGGDASADANADANVNVNVSAPTRQDRICPRDGTFLKEAMVGEASLDVCGRCEGTFFDSGDMLAAFGLEADPASWDRSETGGTVKESNLQCPRCQVLMDAQDVTHEGKHVEIDRCGKCRGVWLDKNEIDTIVAIGSAMEPLLAAERAKAQEELAQMGDPSAIAFRPPWWKRREFVILFVIVGSIVLWLSVTAIMEARVRAERREYLRGREQNREGATGCPCGCDRSKAMAAALRKQGEESPATAATTIEFSLETISARENVGYITERMIQHRLRLLDLSEELRPRPPKNAQPTGKGRRIDELLEALSAATTYQERQAIKREIYAYGKSALSDLESIVAARNGKPETKRLAISVRKLIESRIAREEAALPVEDGTLRVSADLIVHGERIEIVDAQREKLIGSSFRLWLKIENLTDDVTRTLSKPPSIAGARGIRLPISRWYEEDGDGHPWDGVVQPRTTVHVNVIGDIPGDLKPGTDIDATIELEGGLVIRTNTEASGVIHLL